MDTPTTPTPILTPQIVKEEYIALYRNIREQMIRLPKHNVAPAAIFYLTKDGKMTAVVLPIDINTEGQKSVAVLVVNAIIDQHKPDFVIFVAESWLSTPKAEDIVDGAPKVRPSQDPARRSVLAFQISFKGGGALGLADIEERGEGDRCIPEVPPELNEGEAGGRFYFKMER